MELSPQIINNSKNKEKLPILDPWSVMGAQQGIPGPAPAQLSPESHPTHGQLSPALDQQTPVPAPVQPSPTPTWSGPSPPSQPPPNPASTQPAPAQPTGGERGAISGRRVRGRPAEGAPPEAEPGLCSPPATHPPRDPRPRHRTPDPGPWTRPAPSGARLKPFRARAVRPGERGEGAAPREAKAFVPPVGPAPALHEPEQSRSADRPGSHPGSQARRAPARGASPSEVPGDSFPTANVVGKGWGKGRT